MVSLDRADELMANETVWSVCVATAVRILLQCHNVDKVMGVSNSQLQPIELMLMLIVPWRRRRRGWLQCGNIHHPVAHDPHVQHCLNGQHAGGGGGGGGGLYCRSCYDLHNLDPLLTQHSQCDVPALRRAVTISILIVCVVREQSDSLDLEPASGDLPLW